MAEDNDDKTEDPTQKRLDDAHAKGDVAKSQEVNTWFVICGRNAGARRRSPDRSAAAFSMPMRNLIANSWMIRTDGAGLLALAHTLVLCRDRRRRRAAADAGAGRDRRQHDPAPAGVVRRIAEAEIQQDLARRRLQAHLRQAGGREFRQGDFQAGRARRGHGGGAMAGAPPAGGVGSLRSRRDAGRDHHPDAAPDGRGRGHARRGGDCRLLLPVPAMVRAAENVAAGDEGGIQAVRRRSRTSRARSGSCGSSA